MQALHSEVERKTNYNLLQREKDFKQNNFPNGSTSYYQKKGILE
jgi:hypothetical protein